MIFTDCGKAYYDAARIAAANVTLCEPTIITDGDENGLTSDRSGRFISRIQFELYIKQILKGAMIHD